MGLSYEETLALLPQLASQHPDAPGNRKPAEKVRPKPIKSILSEPYGQPGRCSAIFIPGWHPARLNQLMSEPLGGYKRKKLDRRIVADHIHSYGIQRATNKRSLKALLLFPKGKRAGDPDCYWKSLCDALVQCGALVNDSDLWVKLEPNEYFRGPSMATIIILRDQE